LRAELSKMKTGVKGLGRKGDLPAEVAAFKQDNFGV